MRDGRNAAFRLITIATHKSEADKCRARGSQTAGTIALKKIGDRTSEFTYKEDGKVTITGTRTISADGKISTVKYSGTHTDGKRVSRRISGGTAKHMRSP